MSALSLLSRGNAQVIKTSQEKIEIHYDPEDYFNWRSHQDFHSRRFVHDEFKSHSYWELPPHKTYSTKKGALVLFSEGLALPWWYGTKDRLVRRGHWHRRRKFRLELNTLQDLTGAILSYGRKQKSNVGSHWEPYLHFLSEEEYQTDRQIRPGYSPKRYLSRLFQYWDPNTIYRLQQAGSLRDSVRLQQLTTKPAESSRRHQDLSSAPLKYQSLPVFTSLPLPLWAHADLFTSSGRCTPVQADTENEEELGYDRDILEETSKEKLAIPSHIIGTMKKGMPEKADAYGEEDTWKRKEENDSQKVICHRELGLLLENQHGNSEITRERNEPNEKPSFHTVVSFAKENIAPPRGKPFTTFYGGSFTGKRKVQYGKQDLLKQQSERDESLPVEGFLPPISPSNGPEPRVKKDPNNKGSLKLPPILDETSRVARRNRRLQITGPPKELLIIPLLIHFQCHQPNKEKKEPRESNRDESKSQGVSKLGKEVTSLASEVPVSVTEHKVKIEMDINWNLDPHPDGDILPKPEVPPLGSLPPINGKKGPGNQSSMANLKVPNTNSSNTAGSKAMPTGIIRGSLPEELKESCKGSSVGSLIMSPNGEIVCLSLMGAARDTDVPIRFDFIPEEDEEEEEEEEEEEKEDRLPLESEGQEEQWPCNQQDTEQDAAPECDMTQRPNFSNVSTKKETRAGKDAGNEDSKAPYLHIPKNISNEAPAPLYRKEKKRQQTITRKNTSEDDSKSKQQILVERSNDEQIGEMESTELVQETMPEIAVHSPGERFSPASERDSPNTDEANTSSHGMLRSTPTPDRASQTEEPDQISTDTGLIHAETPGRVSPSKTKLSVPSVVLTKAPDPQDLPQEIKIEDKAVQKSQDKKSDSSCERSESEKKTSHRKSAANMQELQEDIQDSVITAPSAVQGEHRTKQEMKNIKVPPKQQSTKQKTSEGSMKGQPQPSRTSTEVLTRLDKEPSDEGEKSPDYPPQDIGRDVSHSNKKPMTEDEEMELLQQIASTIIKETSKAKEKKKTKTGKTQNPEKASATGAKKAKQGSEKQHGKPAFVVGQPKEKKTEETTLHPKKSSSSLKSQESIQEIPDTHQEEEKEEEPNNESEEHSLAEESQVRSISPTQSEDFNPAPDAQMVPLNSSEVAEQPEALDKHISAVPEIDLTLAQPSEDDIAKSETSEATSTSQRRRKSSRARELSDKAERRRIEVEKKRREREEQIRLEQEQQERMERMKIELEEEQLRRAEEIRLKKQQQEEEQRRQEQEKARRMQLEQQALERARLQQEEHRRKLQELQKRKQQEEMERIALERERQKEREREEAKERLRLLEMEADEREEYKRKKQERDEQARREEEERRKREEEEAKAIMEDAQRQAQLLARQAAALEQQLQFNRGLLKESIGMDQTQGISRPWVFSYFEFLELLGLPLPTEGDSKLFPEEA